jgi:hypothetical protein
MNAIHERLPVPAERDLPADSLGCRKAALVDLVGNDLRGATRRGPRLRRLRGLLGIFIAALALACVSLLAAQARGEPAPVAAAVAVAAGSAPLAAALQAPVRTRVVVAP